MLVLWQDPTDDLPEALTRTDVEVIRLDGRGVAKSRNAAIERVEDGYLQFWDDDMTPDMAGIETVVGHMESNRDLSVMTARRRGLASAEGPMEGPGHALSLRNIARTATPEITIRAEAVRGAGVRFDEDFGLGATYPLGDEFVFLADLLRAGLRGWHLPVAIGDHPPVSTGDAWADPVLLKARAAAMVRVFGRMGAIPAAAVFAMKNRERLGMANTVRFPWLCLGARP